MAHVTLEALDFTVSAYDANQALIAELMPKKSVSYAKAQSTVDDELTLVEVKSTKLFDKTNVESWDSWVDSEQSDGSEGVTEEMSAESWLSQTQVKPGASAAVSYETKSISYEGIDTFDPFVVQ